MSIRKTFATAMRVLTQLEHDKRTLVLVLLVPCLLLTLLKYVFQGNPHLFSQLAPMMIGIFALLMMFLVTSIATLRERTSGTLDRLMTQPLSKLDFIFGYALAFSLVGLWQACLTSAVTISLLGVDPAGSAFSLLLVAACAAFLGTALGLFVSAFATSEFQAVQLVMPIMMPQVLLCGLFIARDLMARPLELISNVLPLTYIVDAMKQVTTNASWTALLTKDLAIVLCFGVVALVLGSVTIRRQQ